MHPLKLFLLFSLLQTVLFGTPYKSHAQTLKIKKGIIEYSDSMKYSIDDSTFSRYFYSKKLNLKYPVPTDSLSYVFANNKLELLENGNKIRLLNGGKASVKKNRLSLEFYHYYFENDSLKKKSLLRVTISGKKYLVEYNPVLIAENSSWLSKNKKLQLILLNQSGKDKRFLQGYIDLRFKVQAYSDNQLLLFTGLIELKGFFILLQQE